MTRSKSLVVLIFLTTYSCVLADDDSIFDRLDGNDDGFVTKDEIKDDDARMFRRLLRTSDKDDDGKLTREEFSEGTTAKPATESTTPMPNSGRRTFDVRQLFGRFDRNKDGKLSREELPEQMRTNFDRLDQDRSGSIDEKELARIAGSQNRPSNRARPNPQLAKAAFQRADKNGDGKLSLDEVPAERRADFRRALERLDDDKDDALTAEQFARVMSMMQGNAPRTPESDKRPSDRPAAAPMNVQLGLLFRTLDADHDGTLSADEIEAASTALGKLDRDNDGALTMRELVGQMRSTSTRPATSRGSDMKFSQVRERAMSLDKDGDKKLSKDELPDALHASFDRFDADDDGELDGPELMKLLPRFGLLMRQQRD